MYGSLVTGFVMSVKNGILDYLSLLMWNDSHLPKF